MAFELKPQNTGEAERRPSPNYTTDRVGLGETKAAKNLSTN